MFPTYTLLATLALAVAVAANPIVIRDSPFTIPLVKRLKANSNGKFNLLERDQVRVRGLRQFSRQKLSGVTSEAAVSSANATNELVQYVVSVSWLILALKSRIRVLLLTYLCIGWCRDPAQAMWEPPFSSQHSL